MIRSLILATALCTASSALSGCAENTFRSKYSTTVRDDAFDVAVTASDGPVYLRESLTGKYALLEFWATWCGPCRNMEPWMKRIQTQCGDVENFSIVSVALEDDFGKVQRYASEHDLEWTHYTAMDGFNHPMVRGLKIDGIPTLFAISPDGHMTSIDHTIDLLDFADELVGIPNMWAIQRDKLDGPSILARYGKPDRFEQSDSGARWIYERLNKRTNYKSELQVTVRDGVDVGSVFNSRSYATPGTIQTCFSSHAVEILKSRAERLAVANGTSLDAPHMVAQLHMAATDEFGSRYGHVVVNIGPNSARGAVTAELTARTDVGTSSIGQSVIGGHYEYMLYLMRTDEQDHVTEQIACEPLGVTVDCADLQEVECDLEAALTEAASK